MNRRIGWIQISPPELGRKVFVKAMHYPLVAAWKKQKDYVFIQLTRQLDGLTADASTGDSVNTAGSIRSKTLKDKTKIEYLLDNGDVLVTTIKLSKATTQASGLRRVAFERQEWVTKQDTLLDSMEYAHTWSAVLNTNGLVEQVDVHFAAVSGVYQDAEDAGRLLGRHITGAYGEQLTQFNPDLAKKRGNHYSLLYLNKGDHSSKKGAYLMSTAIKQNAQADARVHTVVQGLAAKTFVNVAEQFNASTNKEAMQKQQFFFSNPQGVNHSKLKAACEAMGATYTGIRVNPFDLRQKARNAAAELYQIESNFRKVYHCVSLASDAALSGAKFVGKAAKRGALAGAGAGAAAAGTGALGDAFKFTDSLKLTENLTHVVDTLASGSPYGKAALCAVGALVIVGQGRAMHKHYANQFKNMKAIGKSTIGKANQVWFEDSNDFRAAV